MWMSSQKTAVASQNFTRPVVSGVDAALTAAVKVIVLPEEIDVAGTPADVTDRVVVVGGGALLTFTARGSVAVSAPEVPEMIAENVPMAAAPAAASVSTLLPAVGFVFHDPVTPQGSPVTARLTLPLNPF